MVSQPINSGHLHFISTRQVSQIKDKTLLELIKTNTTPLTNRIYKVGITSIYKHIKIISHQMQDSEHTSPSYSGPDIYSMTPMVQQSKSDCRQPTYRILKRIRYHIIYFFIFGLIHSRLESHPKIIPICLYKKNPTCQANNIKHTYICFAQ